MKKWFPGWLAFSVFCSQSLFAQQPDVPSSVPDAATAYAATITAADLSRHLHVIASDSLQGRGTGEVGQKMAADYIAGEFFEYGLKPLISLPGGSSTYYQSFILFKRQLEEARLEIAGKSLAFPSDFMPLGKGSIEERLQAPLVFAGYGMESTDYSDYRNVEVKDKIALVFLSEPKDRRGLSLISRGKGTYRWQEQYQAKVQLARQKGARLVFLIDDCGEIFGRNLQQYAHYIQQAQLGFGEKVPEKGSPSLFLSLSAAARVLGVSEGELKREAGRLSRKKKSRLHEVPEVELNVVVRQAQIPVETENVLGLIEGTDRKEEVLVITAHYDHLGKEGDVVYNGANDDGSGTAAVLELAQAFAMAKAAGHGPRRSILFMTVTGEEKGLLGSEYYTEHPVIPLGNTIANLNIDMIGRVDDIHQAAAGNKTPPDYIYLIGSDKLSSELHAISEEANRKYGRIELDFRFNAPNDPNRFYYRSDHYNFAKHGIPVAFYFNGVHSDYHQPTDDVEKMDFGRAERVARLIFHTAWELVNRENRIRVDSAKP
jgi:hypothetical protein